MPTTRFLYPRRSTRERHIAAAIPRTLDQAPIAHHFLSGERPTSRSAGVKRIDLESSRPISLPEPISAGVSVLLHAAIVFGAMTWTTATDSASTRTDIPESAQFLYPLLRPMPKPVEEHISYIGLGGYAPKEVTAGTEPNPVKIVVEATPAQAPAPVEIPVEPPHAYSEIEVDSTVVRDPDSVGPTYPQKLLEAHIEGGTLVRFIVDSSGKVDPSTIRVLESTNPEFAQAVKEVLPKMKFSPAKMGKKPVAQMVEQRFGFRITPPLI